MKSIESIIKSVQDDNVSTRMQMLQIASMISQIASAIRQVAESTPELNDMSRKLNGLAEELVTVAGYDSLTIKKESPGSYPSDSFLMCYCLCQGLLLFQE